MIKITDLEKFAESDIYKPYKSMLDDRYKTISTPIPRDLEHSVYHLMCVPDWRKLVVGRIKRIGYKFPTYINHPLVEYLQRIGAAK